MADILIKEGMILTMNKDRKIIEDGAIAVEDGKIVAVGPSKELEKTHKGKTEISARNKLIMPGLIDAHVHLHYPLAKGLLDDISCMEWMDKVHSLIYPFMDKEAYYINSLLSMIEMLKTGTTCFAECGTMPTKSMDVIEDSVIKAVKEVGLRAVLGRTVFDIYKESGFKQIPDSGTIFVRETTDEALKRGEDFIKRFNDIEEGRIKAWLTLMQVPTSSDALCLGVKEIAEKYGVGIMTHAGVVEPMVELTIERFGLRDIERLDKLGILGPNVLSAHMGWLSGKEFVIVKEKEVNVAHCPSSSMHGAYGSISRGLIPEMLEAGINVAIGCDGTTCSNHLDMVRQMYLVATAHKEVRLSAKVMHPSKVVEMATLNGAKALLLDGEVGAIEVGKRADLILFDLKRPEWTPVHKYNLINNLVYSASGDSVDTVIVDGKILMEKRKIKTIDEEVVIERAQEKVADLLRSIE